MAIIIPPRLASILREANVIAPRRRTSSDGTVGDAAHRASGGDHNPDARGVVHAVDLGQSMPGTPYWESRFDQFDVWAWQRRIASAYVASSPSLRALRWPWLEGGGYMVGFDGNVDVIFHPEVSLGWRINGSPKQDHNQHGHFSIAHTVQSENDTQPVFTASSSLPEDDMPLNKADLQAVRDIVKQELNDAIGGPDKKKPGQWTGRLGATFLHYTDTIAEKVAAKLGK